MSRHSSYARSRSHTTLVMRVYVYGAIAQQTDRDGGEWAVLGNLLIYWKPSTAATDRGGGDVQSSRVFVVLNVGARSIQHWKVTEHAPPTGRRSSFGCLM